MISAALNVFLVAACIIAIAAEPNSAAPVAVTAVLISLILLRRRVLSNAARMGPVLLALGVFVATVCAAAFWGVAGPLELAERAGKIALFALAGGVAACTPISSRAGMFVLMGMALGGAAVAVALIENSTIGALASLFVPDDAGELESIFIRANLHKAPSVILALLSFPLAFMALSVRGRDGGAMIWAPVAVVLAGIVIAGHETALIALTAGIVAAALAWKIPRITAALIVVVAGFLMFAAPALLLQSDLKPLLDATRYSTSIQHRVLIADFAAARIAEKPVWGWGLDSARAMPDGSTRIAETPERLDRFAIEDVTPTIWLRAQNMPLHPHNLAFQIRLELGLPGALAALIVLVVVVAGLARMPSARARAMLVGMLVVYLSVASISYGAWQSWWLSVLVLVVLSGRCALAASARLRGGA